METLKWFITGSANSTSSPAAIGSGPASAAAAGSGGGGGIQRIDLVELSLFSAATWIRTTLGVYMSPWYADVLIGFLFLLACIYLFVWLLRYLWRFGKSIYSVGAGFAGTVVTGLVLATLVLLGMQIYNMSIVQFPAEHERTRQTFWLIIGTVVHYVLRIGGVIMRQTWTAT
jgi:hypothetical protein